jgi:hypothetical protein
MESEQWAPHHIAHVVPHSLRQGILEIAVRLWSPGGSVSTLPCRSHVSF